MPGSARVVSSVTNITVRPSLTHNATDSSAVRSILSSVQSSANRRIEELPMKALTSTATPVRCTIPAIGSTSATTVRAAQLGSMASPASRISSQSRVTSSTALGPAAGSPMSAAWSPSSCMRCSRRILAAIGGSVTDGDCRPSRRVSSFSSTWRPHARVSNSATFQS